MKFMIYGALIALLTITTSFVISETDENEGYKIGDVATDFSLKGIDDKMHALSDFKEAKGFIVIFTCNHCPYAKMYEDRIIALQSEFEPKGYPVIAINPNDPKAMPSDSFKNMKKRAKEKSFNFHYLFDDGQKIYPQYGATKTPHVFLLDKERVVKYIGAIDDNARDAGAVKERFLANAINALMDGKEINPKVTKAIGCSIKSK